VYRELFLKHFTCRIAVAGYSDLDKNPARVREFASARCEPRFAPDDVDGYQPFHVSVPLRSQDAGAMETSMGVVVLVVVEKTSPEPLIWPAEASAGIRIDDAELVFDPRPRDETVKV
jgi:hypothetical protein